MAVRFRRVAISSKHNRATERFAAGTMHSAHVSWSDIRSMPLTTFYHFSVHPCADLYYYTTVDVPAMRDPCYVKIFELSFGMGLVPLYILAE